MTIASFQPPKQGITLQSTGIKTDRGVNWLQVLACTIQLPLKHYGHSSAQITFGCTSTGQSTVKANVQVGVSESSLVPCIGMYFAVQPTKKI